MEGAADLALAVRLRTAGLDLVAVQPWAEVMAARPDAQGFAFLIQDAEKAGDHAAVARLHAEAATAHPADDEVLNSAAWYLVTCPAELRDPARAVAWAAEAVRLSKGRKAWIRDTLAEALLIAGRIEEAAAENAAALRLEPGHEGCRARVARIAAAAAGR